MLAAASSYNKPCNGIANQQRMPAIHATMMH
jgi:hypothetical protein